MPTSAPPAAGDAGIMTDLAARAEAFFAGQAPLLPVDEAGRVVAPSAFATHAPHGDSAAIVDAARRYQRALADAALAGLTVPTAYGGQGLAVEDERALQALAGRYDLPPTGPLLVGLSLVVPTLLAHGTEDQKQRHISRILRADELWCQLFSEPGAGSDLAALSTRAVADGDGWLIDGQKVWTSFAEHADHGLLLARTSQEDPAHAGITMFAVPMDREGIEVRPLKEMTGGTHFSEVFLTGVRLPADTVIGELNSGWKVAMTTLSSERSAGGGHASSHASALIALARERGCAADSRVRDAIAGVYTDERILESLAERVRLETDAGRPPIWGNSVLKLRHAALEQRAARAAALISGMRTIAWEAEAPDAGKLAFELLHSRMWSIAGGSDEIQRNILAERALGLPREAR